MKYVIPFAVTLTLLLGFQRLAGVAGIYDEEQLAGVEVFDSRLQLLVGDGVREYLLQAGGVEFRRGVIDIEVRRRQHLQVSPVVLHLVTSEILRVGRHRGRQQQHERENDSRHRSSPLELKQDSNSKNMIHGIAEQIAALSHQLTLRPGDVIATGTPAGVGAGRGESGEFLKAGDEVKVEVQYCGTLVNHMVDAS